MTISSFHRPPAFAGDEQAAPIMSDDECLSRLAYAIAEHDDRRLDEVAQLIGRLAVPIE